MTLMRRKDEDKAFTIYAITHKNMCENVQREHMQTWKDKLHEQHDT